MTTLIEVEDAITRLTKAISDSEDFFVKHVGVKDMSSNKKANGYFDYINADRIKLSYLDKLRKDLINQEKLAQIEAEKAKPKHTAAQTKEWNNPAS